MSPYLAGRPYCIQNGATGETPVPRGERLQQMEFHKTHTCLQPCSFAKASHPYGIVGDLMDLVATVHGGPCVQGKREKSSQTLFHTKGQL